MSEPGRAGVPLNNADEPSLERLARDRREGEIESGMLSGSDDGEISATERFEGDVSPEEALEVLAPASPQRG